MTFQDGRILSEKRVYSLQSITQTLERARIEVELRVASEVQRALLPRTCHAGDYFEAVGASVACRAIGGDFFEYADLSSSEVGALGDVSGKGPAAALLASLLQGIFSVESRIGGSPSGVLQRMNHWLIQRHIEPRFATLVYGVLSRDGRFVYSNAGHNPPLLLRAGEVRHLRTGGPILGVFSDAVFSEETLSLEKGDTIVLFTDGVTEAFDAAGEEFGEQRLISCVTTGEDSPSELLDRVFSTVKEFCRDAPQSDDLTMTVIRFR